MCDLFDEGHFYIVAQMDSLITLSVTKHFLHVAALPPVQRLYFYR